MKHVWTQRYAQASLSKLRLASVAFLSHRGRVHSTFIHISLMTEVRPGGQQCKSCCQLGLNPRTLAHTCSGFDFLLLIRDRKFLRPFLFTSWKLIWVVSHPEGILLLFHFRSGLFIVYSSPSAQTFSSSIKFPDASPPTLLKCIFCIYFSPLAHFHCRLA